MNWPSQDHNCSSCEVLGCGVDTYESQKPNGHLQMETITFPLGTVQEPAKTFSKGDLSGFNSINKPLDKRQNYYYLANLYSKQNINFSLAWFTDTLWNIARCKFSPFLKLISCWFTYRGTSRKRWMERVSDDGCLTSMTKRWCLSLPSVHPCGFASVAVAELAKNHSRNTVTQGNSVAFHGLDVHKEHLQHHGAQMFAAGNLSMTPLTWTLLSVWLWPHWVWCAPGCSSPWRVEDQQRGDAGTATAGSALKDAGEDRDAPLGASWERVDIHEGQHREYEQWILPSPSPTPARPCVLREERQWTSFCFFLHNKFQLSRGNTLPRSRGI